MIRTFAVRGRQLFLSAGRQTEYTDDMGFHVSEDIVPAKSSVSKRPTRGPIGVQESGLRFYNPEVGRWLSRDPIRELGGVNLYNYAHNSAYNYIDALGLEIIATSKKDELSHHIDVRFRIQLTKSCECPDADLEKIAPLIERAFAKIFSGSPGKKWDREARKLLKASWAGAAEVTVVNNPEELDTSEHVVMLIEEVKNAEGKELRGIVDAIGKKGRIAWVECGLLRDGWPFYHVVMHEMGHLMNLKHRNVPEIEQEIKMRMGDDNLMAVTTRPHGSRIIYEQMVLVDKTF